MSLDSSTVGTAGAIATPLATILNPVLGLAVGAGFSFLGASSAADEQRELTQRNIRLQMDAQRVNELRQRKLDAKTVGRFRQTIASSGFTTRGSPIEKLADLVADQELSIQIDRFNATLTAEDIAIRGEHRARQTQATGLAEAGIGLGKAGLTLLNRRDDFDLLE